ncbi:hypothetical protein HGM15179_006604 [Zosterops borbonicus]|uniref:Uncharacterized protein n=1 Tax=Zosterops borbonicus TaxID=364589 RepID=A0A8K1GN48_9PASS|nr:hypothetical protein HGM15179_006604 [Zosterops borbonicus]
MCLSFLGTVGSRHSWDSYVKGKKLPDTVAWAATLVLIIHQRVLRQFLTGKKPHDVQSDDETLLTLLTLTSDTENTHENYHESISGNLGITTGIVFTLHKDGMLAMILTRTRGK